MIDQSNRSTGDLSKESVDAMRKTVADDVLHAADPQRPYRNFFQKGFIACGRESDISLGGILTIAAQKCIAELSQTGELKRGDKVLLTIQINPPNQGGH